MAHFSFAALQSGRIQVDIAEYYRNVYWNWNIIMEDNSHNAASLFSKGYDPPPEKGGGVDRNRWSAKMCNVASI